jgi:UDP-N-acetylmuramate dehydrogenase
MFIYQIALKLIPCPVMVCMDAVSRTLAQRMAKHPSEPSAGCVFVNPEPPDVTAGRLIDELGFKGRRIGDALCSPRHANFIVNLGKATQKDVVELITQIKQAVKKRYGYELREEIKIISSPEGND